MRRCEAQVIWCIGYGVMLLSLRMTYHLILGSVGTREVRRLYLSVYFLYSIFPLGVLVLFRSGLASKAPALAWPEVRFWLDQTSGLAVNHGFYT